VDSSDVIPFPRDSDDSTDADEAALVEIDAAAFRRRAPEHQRGAGRRVHLPVVMHLQDFDVEGIVERLGDAPGERRQEVDAEAHIAGLHDHRALGRVLDPCFVGSSQTRGADDVDLAALGRERGKGDRRRWRGEVDNAVGLGEQRRRVTAELDAVFGKAGELASELFLIRQAGAMTLEELEREYTPLREQALAVRSYL